MNKHLKIALIAPIVLTSQMLSSWTVVSSSEQMTDSIEASSERSSLEQTEDGFIILSNGDRAKKGFGSVSDEVKNFYSSNLSDFSKLSKGLVSGSQGLFFGQSKDNVYFYTYDSDASQDFFSVSMDVNEGSFENGAETMKAYVPSYTLHPIEKVSFSADGRFVKWKTDLPVSFSDRVYYVRELVGDGQKMDVSGRYYIKADGEEHVTPIETISITSKDVAWQLTNVDNNNNCFQYHYVAFDTDIKMDSVSKIEIEYRAKYFGGRSNLGAAGLGSGNPSSISNTIKDVDFRKNFDNPELYFEYPIIGTDGIPDSSKNISSYAFSTGSYDRNGNVYTRETITPATTSATFDTGLWFWRTSHTYNMTTLSTYDELVAKNPEETILSENNLASKHKWFCCFLQNQFNVGYKLVMLPSSSVRDDKLSFGLKSGVSYRGSTIPEASEFEKSKMPIDIEDLSILKLTYEKDGITHSAVAVDTYDDSKGTSNIVDPSVETPLSALEDFFKKLGDWFGDYGVYVLLGFLLLLLIVLFPFAGSVLKGVWFVLKYLFKGLWWLLSAPVKFIRHLCKKD